MLIYISKTIASLFLYLIPGVVVLMHVTLAAAQTYDSGTSNSGPSTTGPSNSGIQEQRAQPTVHLADNNAGAILWASEDFEPFYIESGEFTNSGTADQLINLIKTHLPDYRHDIRHLPINRIVDELRAGTQVVCISFLYDPSITDFAQYSDPVFVLPPQELIMLESLWQQDFESAESLSLMEIMTTNKYVLGLSDGRNYGKSLNPIIEKLHESNGSQLYLRTGSHFSGLAEMLQRERISFTIAYSGEQKFFSSRKNSSNSLVSVPIKENVDPLLVYAVMPRTDAGNQLLSDFNAALKRARMAPEYRQAVVDWFAPTARFDQAWRRYIWPAESDSTGMSSSD